MTYVALLRGINVGGKNKIEMKRLRASFEHAGMMNVSTYINSGNVIFQHDSTDTRALARTLEQAIEAEFGLDIKVLLRDSPGIAALVRALPDSWSNDEAAKCDVMFLWEALDGPGLLDRLTVKPGIDEVIYVSGAVLWRVDRPKVTRSGMMKLVGTDDYKQMTVRNCNTVRKLAELVSLADTRED